MHQYLKKERKAVGNNQKETAKQNLAKQNLPTAKLHHDVGNTQIESETHSNQTLAKPSPNARERAPWRRKNEMKVEKNIFFDRASWTNTMRPNAQTSRPYRNSRGSKV
jgi:hypothetical protein